MSKKKKGNRTEEARRGTKVDPERIEAERRREARRELESEAGLDKLNQRPSWYLEELDRSDLSKRETTTLFIFIAAEFYFFLNIGIYFLTLSAGMEEFSLAAFQELFTSDVNYVFEILGELLQILAGSIVVSCYKHYIEGDAGYVLYNLIILACSEVVLQNIFGTIFAVVLLWRVWKRCSVGLSDWQIDRTFMGKVADCAPGIVLLVIAAILYYAGTAV